MNRRNVLKALAATTTAVLTGCAAPAYASTDDMPEIKMIRVNHEIMGLYFVNKKNHVIRMTFPNKVGEEISKEFNDFLSADIQRTMYLEPK